MDVHDVRVNVITHAVMLEQFCAKCAR